MFFDDEKNGYAYYSWPEGSKKYQKAFYLDGRLHGISLVKLTDGEVIYELYDNGHLVEELSESDV